MPHSLSRIALAQDIVLHTPSRDRIDARATALRLGGQPGSFTELRMHIEVDLATYQRIERDKLLHLEPSLFFWSAGEAPRPGAALTVELVLQPALMSLLENDLVVDVRTAADFLAQLADADADAAPRAASGNGSDDPDDPDGPHPLLATDSWLCLSVTQDCADAAVGYRTFWSYLDPVRFHESEHSGALLAGAIVDFVADWTKASLSSRDGDAIDHMVDQITAFLDDLMRDKPVSSGADAPRAATARADTPSAEPPVTGSAVVPGRPIHDTALAFFRAEGWPVSDIAGSDALRVSYRGASGAWTCLAQAREVEAQLLFYSICPVAAQRTQYPAAAEAIARANAGLILGNFELDYADGEIRFKTSIDVEGDRLTTALLERLVYANVNTTDQYLPALRAVIEGGVAPAIAIARVEAGGGSTR